MNYELKNRLVVTEKAVSLHRLKKRDTLWRDGRVIDCSGLENRRTARYRGFESLSLRFKGCKSESYLIYTLFHTQQCAF
jgi:hypothetical protein